MLTFSTMALGVAVAASPYGLISVWQSLLGIGVAFAVHYLFYSMALEGAGDAKLMMGVGAFVGYAGMLEATLWRYILLIPYAVIIITVLGRWQNFRAAVKWVLARSRGMPVGERPEAANVPFGPLLAIAVPIALNTTWLEYFG